MSDTPRTDEILQLLRIELTARDIAVWNTFVGKGAEAIAKMERELAEKVSALSEGANPAESEWGRKMIARWDDQAKLLRESRAYAELITAPARELLELYDLRPKLAEMEACDMAAWGKLQSDTKAALRQYGERKKAGWIALRAALGARVTATEILEKNAEASRPETNREVFFARKEGVDWEIWPKEAMPHRPSANDAPFVECAHQPEHGACAQWGGVHFHAIRFGDGNSPWVWDAVNGWRSDLRHQSCTKSPTWEDGMESAAKLVDAERKYYKRHLDNGPAAGWMAKDRIQGVHDALLLVAKKIRDESGNGHQVRKEPQAVWETNPRAAYDAAKALAEAVRADVPIIRPELKAALDRVRWLDSIPLPPDSQSVAGKKPDSWETCWCDRPNCNCEYPFCDRGAADLRPAIGKKS